MKLWLTAFTVLFAIAELYQWLTNAAWTQQFDLPLPMMMLAGAGLAIASNYDKRVSLPWRSNHSAANSMPASPSADSAATPESSVSPPLSQVAAMPKPTPPSNLPVQERSISFTISKKPK
jgi:hypothetical protein